MKHELPVDILASQPVHPAYEADMLNMGLNSGYLEGVNIHHASQIRSELGNLSVALALSRSHRERHGWDPETDTGVGRQNSFNIIDMSVHPPAEHTYDLDDFESEYKRAIESSPRAKLALDTKLVMSLLYSLGPTNTRAEAINGYDAGIDFGVLINLLESDYLALPERKRKPELRMAEAYLRQELALLWTAPGMKGATNNKGVENTGFLFDLEDRNIFTEDEIASLPEADRWKIIGAKLADESADLYQQIYEDISTVQPEKIEAMCRMTDMRIRSVLIKKGIKNSGVTQDNYLEKINKLGGEFTRELENLEATLVKTGSRGGVPDGLFFELHTIARIRNEILEKEVALSVRLATPREDKVHINSPHYITRGGEKELKLSHDAVVEDLNGRVERRIQVKAKSRQAYDNEMSQRKTPITYLPELVFRED